MTARRFLKLHLPAALAALLCSGAVCGGAGTGPREAPRVIAHRGAAEEAPENTLPAIARAVELGCAVVEVDVRYTADGHPILMHDSTLDRNTTGRGPVSALTLRQIRRLRARNIRTDRTAAIPTLRSAIEAARGRILLLADIKEADPLPAARTVARMRAAAVVLFRPSSRQSLERIAAAVPGARFFLDLSLLPPEPEVLRALHREVPGAAYFSAPASRWTDAMLREAASLGADAVADFLQDGDHPENWRRAAARGLRYFLTDHPAQLLGAGGRAVAGAE